MKVLETDCQLLHVQYTLTKRPKYEWIFTDSWRFKENWTAFLESASEDNWRTRVASVKLNESQQMVTTSKDSKAKSPTGRAAPSRGQSPSADLQGSGRVCDAPAAQDPSSLAQDDNATEGDECACLETKRAKDCARVRGQKVLRNYFARR